MRTWGNSYYTEIKIRKDKLDKFDVLYYIYGHEIEGNNDWRTIAIIPTGGAEQIDKLFEQIKDFDSFGEVIRCIHNVCTHGGDCRDVVCDLDICRFATIDTKKYKYCGVCLTLMRDLEECIKPTQGGQ
ncbi:MAG: hypothetical protein JHC26_01235 [Thermofilum sp.]|uniref:hypothetical protein n=1 Tax=Thermofilum sp. TaxID=1961369 RepID=UPI0025863E37|nr:hypothetical protein [Thermofilum sp.]MCI4407683.1 hypothetical protein [Thermofilum sp.]